MLLRCIAGLERPDRGRVALNDRVFFDSGKHIHLPARQRRIGMLFQNYALFPHRSIAENISFGLESFSSADRNQRVAALIERTHLAGLEDRYPRELSGGEQQRVALARALAIEPEALLLDEPLSALDTHLRSQMEAQLQQTFAAYRRPSLLVTHNIDEAYRLGVQMIVVSRGRVAAAGAKDEIFRKPPSVEVARLTGCKNISRARAVSGRVIEAIDWGCNMKVSQEIVDPPKYVGIRAHHIKFTEFGGSSDSGSAAENIFPCWFVSTSEGPFSITLYLTLREPGAQSPAHRLHAEISKEYWQDFREKPYLCHARFSPDALFLMTE